MVGKKTKVTIYSFIFLRVFTFILFIANFETVSDVIYHNETELSKILNLSSKDIKELVKCIAQEIIKPCPLLYPLTNALKMLNSGEQCMLTTGDDILDKILGGGIMSRGITEIVGERY